MNKISVLDDITINKIAAGEVVESPASVVKELVENAFDAKASKVSVQIKGGGLFEIVVEDNGSGMGEDDALLSLERHATSKIKSLEDLLVVPTMGFRGEALASIASVSKFELETTLEGKVGTKIEGAGGKIYKVCKCNRVRGTKITIRSLFYNVPARKKFQKSSSQSLSDVVKVLMKAALSSPEIAMQFISNGKTVFESPSYDGDLLDKLGSTIKDVLGDGFLGSSFYTVHESIEGVSVVGFLSHESKTRPNKTGQHLFINKRSVASSALSFAIRDGYGWLLPERRYPECVLHIALDPDRVDVNVHPQKLEVKFSNESMIKQTLKRAVAQALRASSLKEGDSPKTNYDPELFNQLLAQQQSHCIIEQEDIRTDAHIQESPVLENEEQDLLLCSSGQDLSRQGIEILGVFQRFAFLKVVNLSKIHPWVEQGSARDGIYFVDLKNASFRIYFDKLMKSFEGTELKMQSLLFPITISVSSSEELLIEKYIGVFRQMGIELRLFGKGKVIIDACIEFYNEEKLKDIVFEGIDLFRNNKHENLLERLAIISASYASKRNHFQESEAKELIFLLTKGKQSCKTPKGDRILRSMTPHEIEKLFS